MKSRARVATWPRRNLWSMALSLSRMMWRSGTIPSTWRCMWSLRSMKCCWTEASWTPRPTEKMTQTMFDTSNSLAMYVAIQAVMTPTRLGAPLMLSQILAAGHPQSAILPRLHTPFPMSGVWTGLAGIWQNTWQRSWWSPATASLSRPSRLFMASSYATLPWILSRRWPELHHPILYLLPDGHAITNGNKCTSGSLPCYGAVSHTALQVPGGEDVGNIEKFKKESEYRRPRSRWEERSCSTTTTHSFIHSTEPCHLTLLCLVSCLHG